MACAETKGYDDRLRSNAFSELGSLRLGRPAIPVAIEHVLIGCRIVRRASRLTVRVTTIMEPCA
jgi:hypothetical protein